MATNFLAFDPMTGYPSDIDTWFLEPRASGDSSVNNFSKLIVSSYDLSEIFIYNYPNLPVNTVPPPYYNYEYYINNVDIKNYFRYLGTAPSLGRIYISITSPGTYNYSAFKHTVTKVQLHSGQSYTYYPNIFIVTLIGGGAGGGVEYNAFGGGGGSVVASYTSIPDTTVLTVGAGGTGAYSPSGGTGGYGGLGGVTSIFNNSPSLNNSAIGGRFANEKSSGSGPTVYPSQIILYQSKESSLNSGWPRRRIGDPSGPHAGVTYQSSNIVCTSLNISYNCYIGAGGTTSGAGGVNKQGGNYVYSPGGGCGGYGSIAPSIARCGAGGGAGFSSGTSGTYSSSGGAVYGGNGGNGAIIIYY